MIQTHYGTVLIGAYCLLAIVAAWWLCHREAQAND